MLNFMHENTIHFEASWKADVVQMRQNNTIDRQTNKNCANKNKVKMDKMKLAATGLFPLFVRKYGS